MKQPEKIKTISLIILIGFLVSIAYHYILGGWPFNLPYPFNTFVTSPIYRFSDFTQSIYPELVGLDPYRDQSFPPYSNFPFGALVTLPFVMLPMKLALVMFLLTFICFHFYNVYSSLAVKGAQCYHDIIVISCLTFPFLVTIERANFEVIVYIFLSLFLYYYKTRKYQICCIFLSFSIAMKIFPAIFLLLFFVDKKYKEILYIIVISTLALFLPFFIFKGTINENISGLLGNLSIYKLHNIIGYNGVHYGHSLWGAFKVVYYGIIELISDQPAKYIHGVKYLTLPYTLFVLMLTGCITFYLAYKERVFWRKIALLVFAMNLFPFVSGPYKMLYIYLPLLLFINSEPGKRDKIFCILFALLMIPKHYVPLYWTPPYTLSGEIGDLQTWSEVLVDPLLMLVFAGVIIWDGIKMPKIKLSTIKNKVYG